MNTYVSLMYELKKNGKVLTSKFVGTGPTSYEKRIYRTVQSVASRYTDYATRPTTFSVGRLYSYTTLCV